MLNFNELSDRLIRSVDLQTHPLPSYLDSCPTWPDEPVSQRAIFREDLIVASPSDNVERLLPDSFDWMPSRNLKQRAAHLEDVTLDEATRLLQEAVEVYVVLAPTLPTYLLERACDELEFLTNLCRRLAQTTWSNL